MLKILLVCLMPFSFANQLKLTLTQAQRTAWPVQVILDETMPIGFISTIKKDIALSGVMVESDHPKVTYQITRCDQSVCVMRKDRPGARMAFTGHGSEVMLAHQIMDYMMKDTLNVPGWFHNRLAYVTVSGNNYNNRSYQLEVSDITGHETHTVFKSLEPIMSPAWSPDGGRLAYVSFESQQPSLWWQDLKSGQRTKISEKPGINGAPAWSPDGKKLAYVMTVSGHPKIYMVDLHTQESQQITFGRSIDTEPTWDHKGSAIYFTSNRSGSPQIYRFNFSDKQISRVTYEGPYHVRPTISKNNRLLTLTKLDGRWGVMVHDLAKEASRVLSASGTEDQPMIHPEGSFAVYTKRFGSHTMLEIAHVTESIRYRLPAESGTVRFPTWSQT